MMWFGLYLFIGIVLTSSALYRVRENDFVVRKTSELMVVTGLSFAVVRTLLFIFCVVLWLPVQFLADQGE